jgi:hypothetical protein
VTIPKNARHSPDFSSLSWNGTLYSFTPMQAAIVKILWQAAANDTPGVHAATLLAEVESHMKESRIGPLFHRNPAWKTLIIRGARRGNYRLNPDASL